MCRISTITVILLLLAPFQLTVGAEVENRESLPPDGLEEGWYTTIETSKGKITARLLPEQAPQSVAHFAGLAEGTLSWVDPVSGERQQGHYYDGLEVQRAEAGRLFEAGKRRAEQGGTPMLFVPQEGEGPVNFHRAYRLGMTRATRGRISAVEFVVTAAAQPPLTGTHPCFGRILDGEEVIREISGVKTYSNGRPIEPILIESVRVFKIGDPEPLPQPEIYLQQGNRFGLRKDNKRKRY